MPATVTAIQPFSTDYVVALGRSLGAQAPERPQRIVLHDQHSNDVAEVGFGDGRTLVVKRARFDWAARRFESSKLASHLLLQRAGIIAPAPLEVPADFDELPVEAYWRIPLPTLKEVWPGLRTEERPAVLRSWGVLIRRVHSVSLPGYGPLQRATRGAASLERFLQDDLGERLLPAAWGIWPGGALAIEQLRALVPAVVGRVGQRPSCLVHNDQHMGNVLCQREAGVVRCMGLLDLEAAFAGPPEADLANAEVMHGPLFEQQLPGSWFRHVRAGYGAPLDPVALAFFRAYHLLNMGLHSAIVGHDEHAGRVAAAALAAAAAARAQAAPA
jgi:aminoglycoside phosphotransferase (APT) family kinase protein